MYKNILTYGLVHDMMLTIETKKINARQSTDLHMKRYANTVSYNITDHHE